MNPEYSGNAERKEAEVSGGGGGAGGGGVVGGPAGNYMRVYAKASSFTREIKETFYHDQKEKYHMFFRVLKEYNAERISTPGIKLMVSEIFKGHPDLILKFMNFLPDDDIVMTQKDQEEEASILEKMIIDFERLMNP